MNFILKRSKPISSLFQGFIDIHCHLIPEIDDGAKDISQAINLIKAVKELGIQGFVATPHIMRDNYPNTQEIISEVSERLRKALAAENLDQMFLASAAEHMMDEGYEVQLNEKTVLPLIKNMLLVEMSYFRPPENFDYLIFKTLNQGYQPILAHPERYNFISDFEEYKKIKSKGCLLQLNLLSLTKYYGPHVQKKALRLLKEGVYDFAATDIHHSRHIEKLAQVEVPSSYFPILQELMAKNELFSHQKV